MFSHEASVISAAQYSFSGCGLIIFVTEYLLLLTIAGFRAPPGASSEASLQSISKSTITGALNRRMPGSS